MVEIARVKDGIMEYATKCMMPKMDSKGQFVLGMGLGMASAKLEGVVRELGTNPMVKALGVINGDEMDLDMLYKAAMDQMERQKKLVVDIPLIGRLAFNEQDLRDLYQIIAAQGGAKA